MNVVMDNLIAKACSPPDKVIPRQERYKFFKSTHSNRHHKLHKHLQIKSQSGLSSFPINKDLGNNTEDVEPSTYNTHPPDSTHDCLWGNTNNLKQYKNNF